MEISEDKITRLQNCACEIRVECLKSIYQAKSGHPGGSFSAAEIMAVLYFDAMNIDPSDPLKPDRDRFVLSKGHVAPVLYTTLALRGFFPKDDLRTLRRMGSNLQGHPAYGKLPGIDMASGSLGQGLSVGLGMRLAGRVQKKNFRVFVLIGDGELQEGQIWEAAMAASHFKIDNLIAIVDYNKVQLDGPVSEIMEVAPLRDKWASFGWEVLSVDGHRVRDLLLRFDEAKRYCRNKPVVIIANTVKGKGVSFMENKSAWHGACPDDEEMAQALSEIERNLVGAEK